MPEITVLKGQKYIRYDDKIRAILDNDHIKLISSNLDSKTKKKWKNTIYLLISRYKKYVKRNKNNNPFKLIVLSYLKIKSTYKVKGRT